MNGLKLLGSGKEFQSCLASFDLLQKLTILQYSSFAFQKDSGTSVILGMTVKMISNTDIPKLDPMPISSQAAQPHNIANRKAADFTP